MTTQTPQTRYGLDNDHRDLPQDGHFPAQSSVPDEEALLDRIVKHYRIPPPRSCHFLDRGDADIYRVETSSGRFYLKTYRPPQSMEQTEAEAAFVTALGTRDVPVVKPVPRKDGSFASQINAAEGPRPMLLFEEAPPPFPAKPDEALVTRLGEKVALLHATADKFETDFGVPIVDIDAFLEERVYYTNRFLSPEDQAYLNDVAQHLGQFLRQLPRQTPDFGLCHADLVMSNLRLATDGTVTFFDFGNTLQIWRAFELALVCGSLSQRQEDGDNPLWPAFLRGYELVRARPEALDEHLPVMMVLRQIGFLGGNCATLPLRLGTALFESSFLTNGMQRLRELVGKAHAMKHR